MKISASEYISIASLLMLEGNGEYPTDRGELATQFERTYSYDCNEDWAAIIVKYLEHWGAISVHYDQFAGETFRMFGGTISETVTQLRETELHEVISAGKYEGARWFKKVFDSQHFWPKLFEERQLPPKGPNYEAPDFRRQLVPAADRIVLASDNQPEIDQIKAELAEIIRILANKNNEVGAELADGRDVIDNELAVAEDVLNESRFRLASLWGWLLPVLRFLSKRFAGTSIDEAAKRLIRALETLI